MRPDGFCSLAQIQKLGQFSSLTPEVAQHIVQQDNKQRFALEQDQAGAFSSSQVPKFPTKGRKASLGGLAAKRQQT